MYVFGISKKYNRIGFHIKYGSYKYMHTHSDFWEFMLTVSGNYTHNINGETVKLKPRTLCIIRPSDCHSIIAEKEKGCSHINISIKEDYLRQIMSIFSLNLYEKLLSSHNPAILLSPTEADEIIREANYILSKTKKRNEDSVLTLVFPILKILINDATGEDKKASNYGKLVSDIISLISDKDNLSLTLKELIAATGYSCHHANRRFLEETGQSLFEYFHIEKMLYAKTMLTNTDYTLDTIAQKLGYSTAYAFSASFKKLTGIPPSVYAQTHQKDYILLNDDGEPVPPDL